MRCRAAADDATRTLLRKMGSAPSPEPRRPRSLLPELLFSGDRHAFGGRAGCDDDDGSCFDDFRTGENLKSGGTGPGLSLPKSTLSTVNVFTRAAQWIACSRILTINSGPLIPSEIPDNFQLRSWSSTVRRRQHRQPSSLHTPRDQVSL